jgi:hypothetical protein
MRRIYSGSKLYTLHSKLYTLYTLHSTLYTLQIALWQNYIGVEDNDVVTLGTLHTIVATLAWATVLLIVIMQSKDACVLVANILARFL